MQTFPFSAFKPMSTEQEQACVKSFALTQSCPILKDVKSEEAFKLCLQLERYDLAALLLPLTSTADRKPLIEVKLSISLLFCVILLHSLSTNSRLQTFSHLPTLLIICFYVLGIITSYFHWCHNKSDFKHEKVLLSPYLWGMMLCAFTIIICDEYTWSIYTTVYHLDHIGVMARII